MRYSHNRSIKNDKKNESENKMRRVATIGFCIFGVGLLGAGLTFLIRILPFSEDCTSGECLTQATNLMLFIILMVCGLALSMLAYICHLLNKFLLKITNRIINIYILIPVLITLIILYVLFQAILLSIRLQSIYR